MRKIYLNVLCLLLASCAAVDVERNLLAASGPGITGRNSPEAENPLAVFSEPEIVVVERPVFVPEKEAAPRAPAAGDQAVRAANGAGIVRPQDFSHAAMVYDYHPDWVYEIYAQPLRVCDIALEPGERALEPPFVSDSERWVIGAGVSMENGTAVQHIYVKPASQGLEASLIINTDRRVYRIILRSFSSVHMPLTRWRYQAGLPNNYLPPPGREPQEGGTGNPVAGIDPRFLSFNYRITYSLFQKPAWLPRLVFDDGSKTYVVFPDLVLQRELPAVFENRRDVLNYRVMGSVIIIDKLVESMTVKIARNEITIIKKRG